MEIPTNTTKDTAIEKAVEYIINRLNDGWKTATVTNSDINKAQARQIADMFYEKGYHHEITMHLSPHGERFFYCLTVSKTPIESDNARFEWSEYVR